MNQRASMLAFRPVVDPCEERLSLSATRAALVVDIANRRVGYEVVGPILSPTKVILFEGPVKGRLPVLSFTFTARHSFLLEQDTPKGQTDTPIHFGQRIKAKIDPREAGQILGILRSVVL